MKNFICVMLVFTMLVFTFGCASDQTIPYKNNKTQQTEMITFKTYGWFSLEDKNPNVHYKVSIGNIIWSIILIETIIVPVILMGWYLYEPVNQIGDNKPIGAI